MNFPNSAEVIARIYRERVNSFSAALVKINRAIFWVSNARLVLAVLFSLLVYLGLTYSGLYYLLLPFAAGFIFLLRMHNRLFAEKSRLEQLVELNKWEQDALEHKDTSFPNGHRFVNPNHAFSHDLDLFGEASLFQYLNRCGSLVGEAALAKSLTQFELTQPQIIDRQKAVKELSTKLDFRQNVWAHGRLFSENINDKDSIIEWLQEASFIYPNRYFSIFLYLWPTVTILLTLLSLASSLLTPFALLSIGTQWMLTVVYWKKTTRLQAVMGRKKKQLEKYTVLLRLIEDESFGSDVVCSLQTTAREASEKLKRLTSLANALENRMNAMASAFGNSFFLYDLHCIYALEEWRTRYGQQLPKWLDGIAEMDRLCSFGTFYYNNPGYVFAQIEEKQLMIEGRDMGHPLIPDKTRVVNPVLMGIPHKALIITGANMAGKSTYLRAIGVNFILAMNGVPVCAHSMRCSILDLHTGMRTADSLHENQSYFYAELNRLKTITSVLATGKPVLVLLDEILRGTNSDDKHKGSIALVKQLLNHNALTVVATHDLALGEMKDEFPDLIFNYSFESTISSGKLSFDYKLKEGIAKNANATFLMKQMGIIPDK